MKKHSIYLLLLLSLMFMNVSAQQVKIKFHEFDLDNGLHVILHEDHTSPNVIVSVMYHVGSKNENPNLTGFAHFFEHLMFEGSENIDRGEFSKYVENAGGTLNANTTNDRTFYYEFLPSNYLELGLWLESERMLHAKVDSVGIQTQKKVVIEEKKMRYDNAPYGTILSEALAHAYTKHPYRWAPIGSEEHIMNAKDSEFKRFYEDFYVPNNAVLVIAGDIKIKKTKKLVKKYFKDIPRGTKEIYRPTIKEPVKYKEVRDTVYDDIQLPAIVQAYHIPAMGTEDFYAVQMLSNLLSSGESSRFQTKLVDEKQLALQVMAVPLPFEDPGLALTFALPNMGVDLQVLEGEMEKELDKVKTELISDKDFQKLRNQFESQVIRSNATIEARANNLADNYTYFKNTDLINQELDKYMSVTKEDIKRVANKYFRKDNRVVLYYLPKK
ncbi:MAG: peptidase M16 [Bacteroidetes bacterium]|nr:MAG: peptidase M16 [Bacteroidota bacterium]